jgi:hypothetical protein
MKLNINCLLLGILFVGVIQIATFAADSPYPYVYETAVQRDARMKYFSLMENVMFVEIHSLVNEDGHLTNTE